MENSGFVCCFDPTGWFARVRSVGDVNMRVKRVFLAAMFCCCISVSRLLQIRSVEDPRVNFFLIVPGYFYLLLRYLFWAQVSVQCAITVFI